MAGYSRGKPPMPFTTEQFGLLKGEIVPASVVQPPPNYPPQEHSSLAIKLTPELGYLIELKRDFTEYMRESMNNILPIVLQKDIERHSDRYQDECKLESNYDWSRMPAELRPSRKRKRLSSTSFSETRKKRRIVDIETKFAELEKKENTQENDVEEENKDKEEEEEKEENTEMDEQVETNERIDEEMDDGTDYANSYFDNGEGYDDEEENVDDGPVY